MIRRMELTVSCAACPLQIEGHVDVEDGYTEDERTVLRRVFVYYRERHDRWTVRQSPISVDFAVRGTILVEHGGTALGDPYTYEEDQYDPALAVQRILAAVDPRRETIDGEAVDYGEIA